MSDFSLAVDNRQVRPTEKNALTVFTPTPLTGKLGACQSVSKLDHTPSVQIDQIYTWSILNQAIVSGKTYTRPYVLWCMLRQAHHSGHCTVNDALALACQTGKARSTQYSWLQVGNGIFWHTDGQDMYLVGKDKIFDHFLGPGSLPGSVCFVPADLILDPKLHVVRACLSATWNTKDSGLVRARITRRNCHQGVPERTQFNYDQTAGVRKRPLSVCNHPEKRQLSNWYGRPDWLMTSPTKRPTKANFHGYRPVDSQCCDKFFLAGNGSTDETLHGRRYFDNPSIATETANKRTAKGQGPPCYLLLPDSDRSFSGPAIKVMWLS